MTESSAPDHVDPPEEGGRRSRRSDQGSDGGAASGRSSRRRLVLVVGGAVAVLVVVAVVLLLTQQRGEPEPAVVETITIVEPPPTPEEDPIDRDTSTALLAALPGSVLGYAVSDQTESEPMLDLDALEGWQLTYTAGDAAVVLDVGQWSTADAADEAATALVGDAAATGEDDVLVDGEPVGTVVTFAADEGTERTVWTNSTVVFVVEGPAEATRTFYDAFPF